MRNERFKQLRIDRGMTQQQLANAVSISLYQIQRVESGKIDTRNMTAKNLIALADVLGVDPHVLIEE